MIRRVPSSGVIPWLRSLDSDELESIWRRARLDSYPRLRAACDDEYQRRSEVAWENYLHRFYGG